MNICIIGGGLVGSYFVKITKQRYPQANIQVVEIGANSISELRKDIKFEPIFTNKKYIGALRYRYFGPGGTSNLWSGQLLPFSHIDIKISKDFLFIFDVCKKYQKIVLAHLGIRFFNFYQNLIKNEFISLDSIWLSPFRRSFKKFLRLADSLYINTLPIDFEISNNVLKSIKVKLASGDTKDIRADYFLITAGAIESSRILLEIKIKLNLIKHEIPNKLFGLSDHITFPIAIVDNWSKYKILKKQEPHFKLFNLITYRYIDLRCTKPIFYNFLYNYQRNENFLASLSILEKFQNLPFRNFLNQLRCSEIISFFQTGLYLIFKQRLPNSANLPLVLHCEFAQDGYSNSIELSNEKEECGRRSLHINWSINECELKSIYEESLIKVPKLMAELGVDNYRLLSYNEVIDPKGGYSQFGAAHPCGLSPIGQGLIDENLRVLGINNLYSISSSVLPSSGTVNPTFSLLCLAHHLLDIILLRDEN